MGKSKENSLRDSMKTGKQQTTLPFFRIKNLMYLCQYDIYRLQFKRLWTTHVTNGLIKRYS